MIRSVGNTENKDVPFFPIQVHGPPDSQTSLPWPCGPQVESLSEFSSRMKFLSFYSITAI